MAAAGFGIDRRTEQREAGADEIEVDQIGRMNADQLPVLVAARDQLLRPRLRRNIGGQVAEALPEGDRVRLQLRVVEAPAGADLDIFCSLDQRLAQWQRRAIVPRLAQKRSLTPARTARPL
jgi:hypothetical protein